MLDARCSTTGTKPWAVPFRAADPHKIPIDPNGNLTQKVDGTDTWTYTWNAENQLTKVEKNGSEVARFAYDPMGRRVEKVAGGVTTSYTYDGQDILREVRGGTALRYVQSPGVDEHLAVDDGAASSYFQADGLGSIGKVTNGAGAVTLTRQYDAWGNLEAGANESGYAYTAREWDAEVGLGYYRARYYDPKIGRFISEDPIGFSGGDNFYAYVDNAPTNKADPSGLESGATYHSMWGHPGPNEHFGPPYPPLTCLEKCKLERFKCRLFRSIPAFAGGFACRWLCRISAPTSYAGVLRIVCQFVCTAGAATAGQAVQIDCQMDYRRCASKCSQCGGEQ